jgi:hypothetical protein
MGWDLKNLGTERLRVEVVVEEVDRPSTADVPPVR